MESQDGKVVSVNAMQRAVSNEVPCANHSLWEECQWRVRRCHHRPCAQALNELVFSIEVQPSSWSSWTMHHTTNAFDGQVDVGEIAGRRASRRRRTLPSMNAEESSTAPVDAPPLKKQKVLQSPSSKAAEKKDRGEFIFEDGIEVDYDPVDDDDVICCVCKGADSTDATLCF